MKYIVLFIGIVLLTNCNHWKWATKHQAELCAKCPSESSVTNTDTTYYSIIPADTIILDGIDMFNVAKDTVIIDNSTHRIIREKGKTIIITKQKRVPVIVTRYKNIGTTNRIITTVSNKLQWWIYPIFILLLLVGWYAHKLFQ